MKKMVIISLVLLVFLGCRKDYDNTTTMYDTPPPTDTLIDYTPVFIQVPGTLFGEVVDEGDNPVSGATVVLDNMTRITDEDGIFLYKDVTLNQAGTLVEVFTSGYYAGSYRFFPDEGSVNYTRIRLMVNNEIGGFESGSGGVISDQNGLAFDFSPNSVVDQQGNTYNGSVVVHSRWINPWSFEFPEEMPTSLQGIDKNADEFALAAYTMMVLELTSPDGQPLELTGDQPATVSFPISPNLINSAPSEIPLWYFDPSYEVWVTLDNAVLEGGVFRAPISHTAYWCCANALEMVDLTGKLVTSNEVPFPYTKAVLRTAENGVTGAGFTNNAGQFTGKVPANQDYLLTIWNTTDCPIVSVEIGPFGEDVILDDLEPVVWNPIELTGTIVGCDGNFIENGLLKMFLGNSNYLSYTCDGSNINTAIINCDSFADFLTLQAINYIDGETSDIQNFDLTNALSFGTIEACQNTPSPHYVIASAAGFTTEMDECFITIQGDTLMILNSVENDNEFQFNLTATIADAGIYFSNTIELMDTFLPDIDGGNLTAECGFATGMDCGVDSIKINYYGAVGDSIVGQLFGNIEFLDENMENVNHYLEVDFNIVRE